jgi:hypothetical protein
MRYLAKIFEKEKGDLVTHVRGNLRAVCWKNRCDVYFLTKVYAAPVEGSFTDESAHLVKSCVTEEYHAYRGFVDKSDRMVNISEFLRRHGVGLRNCSALHRHGHPQCIP